MLDEAQGEGLGRAVWQVMREQNPRLFWRSRHGNPVNPFYFAESDGCLKQEKWKVFWYGLDGFDEIAWCVDHCARASGHAEGCGHERDACTVPGPRRRWKAGTCGWSRWRPRMRRPCDGRRPTASCGSCGTPACRVRKRSTSLRRAAAGAGVRRARSLPFVVRDARQRPRSSVRPRYCNARCRQPPRRDRLHLVRAKRAAHRGSIRGEAVAAGACVRDAGRASRWSFETTGSTSARARRSRAWAPSRTACCATISGMRTAVCAIPSCSRSSQSEWPAVKHNLDYRLGITGSQQGGIGRG